MRFKNCFGMIWSVSTFARSSGATSPVCFVNGCMFLLELPLAHVGKVALDRRRRRHHRTHEMRAAAASLAAFEVAITRRGTTLSRLKDVGIHSQTHRTARFAPLKTGFAKNSIKSFTLGRALHFLRTRHDHRTHRRTDAITLHHPRGSP